MVGFVKSFSCPTQQLCLGCVTLCCCGGCDNKYMSCKYGSRDLSCSLSEKRARLNKKVKLQNLGPRALTPALKV